MPYPEPYAAPRFPVVQAFRPVNGLATATLVCAGFAALLAIVAALINPDQGPFSPAGRIQGAMFVLVALFLVANFIVMGLWQLAVNHNLGLQRFDTVKPWKVWVAWAPFVYLIWPLRIMNTLNAGKRISDAWVAMWWLGLLVANGGFVFAVQNPGGLLRVTPTTSTLIWAGSLVSMVGFLMVILGISKGHIAAAPPFHTATGPPLPAIPALTADMSTQDPTDLMRRRF